MRIGIISDTHMPRSAKQIPNELRKGLQGVELVLHAGDWTNPEIIDAFEQIAPVDGVAGNNDGTEIRQRLGRKKIIELAGFRVGIVHGDGTQKTTEVRAWEAFAQEQVDAIIFGHSHIPFLQSHKGVLLFNPGSPTDKRRQPRFSYGLMELSDKIRAKHVFYDEKS